MPKVFNNVAHWFATFFKAAAVDIPKVEATAGTVETLTKLVPVYGPLAATVEDAGYMVLGELASLLTAGGAAAASKLADAGLDTKVIQTVQAVVSGGATLVADVKKL